MDFDEADSAPLKGWMVKKLSNISDADPDVLADYVLALVKTDEPESRVRANCQESLEDFLEDNTKSFIDDVIKAIKNKTYLPAHLRPKKNNHTTPPTAPSNSRQARSVAPVTGKRTFSEAQGSDVDFAYKGRGNKAVRGSRGGRVSDNAGRDAPNGGVVLHPAQSQPQQYSASNWASDTSQFDPNDPTAMFAAMQAMQAMMGFQMPGAPGDSVGSKPNAPACRDFHEKGVCMAGSNCPYDHSLHVYAPMASTSSHTVRSPQNGTSSIRGGRGSLRGGRGHRGQPSAFSQRGPNHDKRNTSIVVEQIPEAFLSESSVHDFFSEFGPIVDVTLHSESRLAIVNFENWASGKAACESPKVIFNNRFVKTYWHKPEGVDGKAARIQGGPHASVPGDDGPPFDKEEFERTQAEAQRKHEERAKKAEEARIAREALDVKIKAHAEALRKLKLKLLPSKNGDSILQSSSSPINGETSMKTNGNTRPTDAQTAALEAQLRALEEEATTLGLPTADDEESTTSGSRDYYNQAYHQSIWPPRGRGRGRGRIASPRGAFGGRGRAGSWAGGAVARLDNRPKNVEVTATNTSIDLRDEQHSEALRTILFNVGDFVSISPHPDAAEQNHRAVVCFRERYVAEGFIAAVAGNNYDIGNIGKCELGWVSNDKMQGGIASTAEVTAIRGTSEAYPVQGADTNGHEEVMSDDNHDDAGERGGEDANGTGLKERSVQEDEDHDIADDDDDRWG